MKKLPVGIMNLFLCSLCLIVLFFPPGVNSEEVCEWVLEGCPENLNGQIIQVPLKVTSVSPKIHACNAEMVFEDVVRTGGPPAIMFVVDHSGSMTRGGGGGAGSTGNDVNGTRFVVTSDLLDTIYSAQPDARVGLVVFREILFFDQRTHDILVPLQGVPVVRTEHENQAYLPPLQLNAMYPFNGTQMSGIDILKYFLQTRRTSDGVIDLTYQPLFSTTGYTNINNAFDAALQGHHLVPETEIPREQRFIVFLSDGIPQPAGSPRDSVNHGNKNPYYFKQGINTPTTFTVYLHTSETTPPDSLIEMTENIKKNGYSETNDSSDIWILRTSYEDLMNLFMVNIIKPILSIQSGVPTFMVVNSITSSSRPDSTFSFNTQFLLQNDTTSFNIDITYHVVNQTTGREFDSTTQSRFSIVRNPAVSEPTEGTMICFDRDLVLYHNGVPVSIVNETMTQLEARFIVANTSYSSITIQITNALGQTIDIVNLPLAQGNPYWSGTFIRSVADVIPGDLNLQHQALDSIILIYRNPLVPLDTIRKAYPFQISKVISFPAAFYYDNNADGYVDSIFIAVDGAISLEDLNTLKTIIRLPAYRAFRVDSISIVSGGLAYHVTDGSTQIRTHVTTEDVIKVDNAILPNGGVVAGNLIFVQDKMAPVLISGKLISSAMHDSVQVVFSEPVLEFISNQPILFSKSDGTEYLVYLERGGTLSGNRYTSVVTSISNGMSISTNDLIWINPPSSISDTARNAQVNPENRKVPISVQEIPYTVVPRVINNPFSPADKIPEPIKNAYLQGGRVPPQNGLVIIIEPEGEILRSINLQGRVSIYDVVKNPIITDIPGVFDTENQKLYFTWDGLNSNGRKVATGTYLATVHITDPKTNLKLTRNLRLGVKR